MKSILIVLFHDIGDAIMATSAFCSLGKKYPDSKIGIVIQSWNGYPLSSG